MVGWGTVDLKLLLISPEIFPVIGGIQRYAYELYGNLPGINVEVVTKPCQTRSGCYKSIKRFIPYDFPSGQSVHSLIKWIRFSLWLILHCKKYNYDVIACAHPSPSGVITFLTSKFLKIPCVIHTYGKDVLEMTSGKGPRGKLEKWVLNRADVVAVSEYCRRLLISRGIQPKSLRVVTPGVHLPSGEWVRVKSEQQIRTFTIISVGRLVKRKRFDLVVSALQELHFPFKCYIIGDGPEYKALSEQIHNLELDKVVVLTGAISDSELFNLYRQSHAFVMVPDLLEGKDAEGFGIVYLEANSFGVPTIGNESGGVPEAIKNNVSGLIVKSSKEISVALQNLYDDRDLYTELRLGALKWAKSNSWDNVSKSYAEELKQSFQTKI